MIFWINCGFLPQCANAPISALIAYEKYAKQGVLYAAYDPVFLSNSIEFCSGSKNDDLKASSLARTFPFDNDVVVLEDFRVT